MMTVQNIGSKQKTICWMLVSIAPNSSLNAHLPNDNYHFINNKIVRFDVAQHTILLLELIHITYF